MEEKDKKLLERELCTRLPYNVVIREYNEEYGYHNSILSEVSINYFADGETCFNGYWINRIENVKPYLRPIYTLTDEEMDRLFDILHIDKDGNDEDWIKINDVMGIKFFFPTGKWIENVDEAYDYLKSIHIDYNGLIAKGLALEAPANMYKLGEMPNFVEHFLDLTE